MAETATSTRVLKAAVVRTSPVLALLGDDQDEARRREAQAELEAAVADAYARGIADGRAAADHEGTAAIPRLADAISAAAAGAAAEAAAQVRTDTSSLFAVAAEVAGWMVGEQAVLDPTVLISRLTDALDGLAPTGPLEIEVAAVQVDAVQSWAGADATVVANPSLGPADAILRAGAAGADLRLEEAVRRAVAALQSEAAGV